MKGLFLKIALFFSLGCLSQTVSIDNTTHSVDGLVEVLLENSCIDFENASLSSSQSVAYFSRNGSSFPIEKGIVIRSGNVLDTQGIYTGNNMGSTTTNGGTDSFLQTLSNTSSGTTESIVDLAYLQFDFSSISDSFNFNFLFASNEYGQYQCLSNDIFAFELIDLATNSITNLAVIPDTSIPVSVKTIKSSTYNNTCSSTNPGFFGVYNVDTPASSVINMRGYTIKLSVASQIIPNHPYRLRMVIADYFSTNYDSAVFIEAGSFTTTFDLGDDRVICAGDEFLLDTELDSTYTFQWFKDNVLISGETGATYNVTDPGVYKVIIDRGTCHIEDTVTFSPLVVNSPQNLYQCNSGAAQYLFDLTQNDISYLGLDSSLYQVYYYDSPVNAQQNISIDSSEITGFLSSGQTIYIKIFDVVNDLFCETLYPFNLIINNVVVAGTNITDETCEDPDGILYDLSQNDTAVINGQTGSYLITYYSSETDAIDGTNAIGQYVTIPSGTETIMYWIRIEDVTNSNCFDVTSVEVTINPQPIVDSIDDIIECTEAYLPEIVNGTYYTGTNGTGTNLGQGGSGTYVDEEGVYYIFAGPDVNGCTNETTFTVTLLDKYKPNNDYCGRFTVPGVPMGIGGFYTDFGGPNGSGTLISPGTVFTNTTNSTIIQSIFYYSEIEGVLCTDKQFDILIHPTPLVDSLPDVTYCDSYTLIPITNGSYYTGPNGTGTQLAAGAVITSTRTIYIYNQISHINSDGSTGYCSGQTFFRVNIVNVNQFTNIYRCESFTLPVIYFGGYFDQPGGQGNAINPAIPITSSQVIYYFAQTTEMPNCTETLNYNITIFGKPEVDEIPDGNYCGEFILPELTNGKYYKLPGGPNVFGQQEIVSPDNKIEIGGVNPPGTYYVYNQEIHILPSGGQVVCNNEHAFTITIQPFPSLDQAINTNECTPYSLPQPTLGNYYTEPDGPYGVGQIVDPNTVYSTTETFYLYYVDPNTGCTIDKEFQRIYKGINLPDFPDVTRCDSYMLPALTNPTPNPEAINYVKYYFNSGGDPVDEIDFANYVFTPNNTPQTVYVYAINTDNHFALCVEEKSFVVTVLETPDLSLYNYGDLDNQNYCGDFTLPALPTGNFNINYYTQQGGNPADIVNSNDYVFAVVPDTEPETYDIWVYAEASGYDESTNTVTRCADETHFQFTIFPRPTFEVEGGIICVDPETNQTIRSLMLEADLDPNEYDIEWYLDGNLMGTGLTYEATQVGTYTAMPIKFSTELPPDCNYEPEEVIVGQSSKALAHVEVTFPFENVANAQVLIDSGYGNYIYQLDDGDFQTSNVFTNLNSGDHVIVVRDTFGYCGHYTLAFTVIKYPNYFTPNEDGVNDTWNIWDLRSEHPESVITIFDRYGKFLKQISPLGNGWDGTYNGKKLPSTDYWFVVEYDYEGATRFFRAHFSLKR